jgi:hypothetical protein
MRSFDTAPVEVRLPACYCPGSPHEADLVYLASDLPMVEGTMARALIVDQMQAGVDTVLLQEKLSNIWVRCVVAWNLVDESGQPVPVTPDNVKEALPYAKGGMLVADKADDLYSDDVMRPLVQASQNSSRRGRTGGSTSATRPSTPKRRPRSSTATTAKAPPAA